MMISRPTPTISRVYFESAIKRRTIRKLGIVGSGNVLFQKIWPALQSGNFGLDLIAVFSLEPGCQLTGLNYLYHPVVPGNLLPLDYLEDQGLLGDDSAWLVATPSDYHVLYTLQLSGRCRRVAVEKPLAANARQARILLPLSQTNEIYPIDHKLFNLEPLAFVDLCRKQPDIMEHISRIEAVFYETNGFDQGRKQEDTISDIQYHNLLIMAAFFIATGHPFEIIVERVQAATHETAPGDRFQTPAVWTASRLRGHVVWRGRQITFDLSQAKAAAQNQKSIRLIDPDGRIVKSISLDETGFSAHVRVLNALMQPVVDMRHELEDAISIMELVDWSRLVARSEPSYEFHANPVFGD
jgi:hypothetical protein